MVNSFYADPALGGNGTTTDDSTSPTTGLDNGGHVARLIPMFSQMVAMLTYVKNLVSGYVTSAAASAASALNAPGTNATTTTSITPAAGSQTFTLVQTGKAFSLGQTLVVASAAAPTTKFIQGVISAFNSVSGLTTINVPSGLFAGTAFADGVVSLGATSGVNSVAGLSGTVTAAALKSALGIAVADIIDYSADQTARANALKAFSVAMAASL